jgi:hypothetical protein
VRISRFQERVRGEVGEGQGLERRMVCAPVLFVSDIDRALELCVNYLGFTQSWRFEEEGKALVAQADRRGCALIFSSQWPDKVGKGLIFISLNVDAALDKLRAEVESRSRPRRKRTVFQLPGCRRRAGPGHRDQAEPRAGKH